MRTSKLQLDTLAVESFATTAEAIDARGTVEAHQIAPTPPERPCTCNPTDLCKTAYYWCGTGPHTIHSCDYTYNGSCAVTA